MTALIDAAARVRLDAIMADLRSVTEDQLHAGVKAFLDAALPSDAFAAHYPAGGKRPKSTAGKMKSMGQVAGMPDWLIVYRGRLFGIELKTRSGRLSPEQIATHDALRRAGACVWLARSVDDVQQALQAWGIPLRARLA